MLLPAILVANIGVPMLLLLWPAACLAWLPLTLLQGELAHRELQLPRVAALRVTAMAKLASTLLGVPLAWAAMLALQIAAGALLSLMDGRGSSVATAVTLPLRSAWLPPTDDAWRVYLAFAVLAVPCCLAARFMELAIARRMLPGREPQAVRAWLKRANGWCYLLVVLAAALYPLATGGRAW